MKRLSLLLSVWLGIVPSLFSSSAPQDFPRDRQDVAVRWWMIPIYAIDREGKAVGDLTGGDIEVYFDRKRVDNFTLVKKELQISSARENPTAAKEGTQVARKKLVFLVFDNSWTSQNRMDQAKKIATAMLLQPDETSQYIVMTIEPFGGLTYIIGPDADRDAVIKTIRRKVSGKKNEFLGSQAIGLDIRDTTPSRTTFGYERPSSSPNRFSNETKMLDQNETLDNQRISSAFRSSLEPLSIILGSFNESNKVVYLFSAGIPSKVFGRKKEYQLEGGKLENERPDDSSYKGFQALASIFSRNGALLFIVNPAGTRINADDPDSGEKSLRMIADDSGGRYYTGTEKEVTGEVVAMERAYYEVYFADTADSKSREFDFEIACRKPGIRIFTLKRLARGKEYVDMSPLEREVLILDAVRSGYFSKLKLKATPFVLNARAGAGDKAPFLVRIPAELTGNEWDVYRVWTGKTSGDVKIELERLIPSIPDITFDLKARKGYRRQIVLLHPRTGIALVGSE